MPEPTPSTTSYLEERRRTLIEQRQRIDSEIAELDAALEAIAGMSAQLPKTGPWSSYEKAIDAIEAYLDSMGRPVQKDQLADALVEGGFQYNRKRPGFNVLDSIRHHSDPGGRLVVDENDMVRRAGRLLQSQSQSQSQY